MRSTPLLGAVPITEEFLNETSARNKLKGEIVEVKKDATTTQVRINIGGGTIVTASTTNEAADELKLSNGQSAYAVIKASDVMVGVD